jgi:ElaB/YqjD/DUF883 family membrane-anchored ribosome-binding protein
VEHAGERREFVQERPWKSLAIGAGAALLIGSILQGD